MKKRILSLVLLGILSLNGITSITQPVYGVEKSNDEVKVDVGQLRVGKLTKISLKRYFDEDVSVSYTSTYPENDNIQSDYIAGMTVDCGGGYVFLRPLTSGTVYVSLHFTNGKSLVITGTSDDIRNSSDDPNLASFWGVIISAPTTNFQYSTVRIEPYITKDGNISHIYVGATLYNKTNKALKPDMRIEFLDEDKHVLGYAQASNQIGSSINNTIAPNEIYTNFIMSADESELDQTRIKDIAYFRVVEPITESGNNSGKTTVVNADISDTEDSDTIKSKIVGVSRLSNNSVKLSWTFDAPKYTIQYATNKKFKNKIVKRTNKNYIKLTKLKANKTYYVRIKGVDNLWSNVTTFKL